MPHRTMPVQPLQLQSLVHIRENVPIWLSRMDELSAQIATRQNELAALSPSPRLVRNRTGSTESLRPKEDNEASQDTAPMPMASPVFVESPSQSRNRRASGSDIEQTSQPRPLEPVGEVGGRHIPTRQIAGAEVRVSRRRRTGSMISAATGVPKYRTRSMIIVYYDSAVQDHFESLVRFISTARNNIRKAKQEARMAAAAKLIMEDSDSDDDDDDDDDEEDEKMVTKASALMNGYKSRLALARFTASKGLVSRGGAVIAKEEPDVYDDIDKALEFCQSMCERGAHQFLREGECNEEIEGMRKRLNVMAEMAKAEEEHLQEAETEKIVVEKTKVEAPFPTPIVTKVHKSKDVVEIKERPQHVTAAGPMEIDSDLSDY